MTQFEQRRLLTPGQVATRFGVTIDAVADWADRGELPSTRTPGGHRRFKPEDVDALWLRYNPAPTPTEKAS